MASDSVGIYLSEIGQTPLLTAEEERELAQLIEAGREADEKLTYLRNLGELGVRDSAEIDTNSTLESERQLTRHVRRGAEAKDRFIRSNLRLVVSIARNYPLPQSMDLLDLIQEGNLGVEHAVDKFDWQKGFKFSTYATFWIRQSIGRALDQKASTIRLPGDRSASLRASLRNAGGDSEQLNTVDAELHKLTSPYSLDKSVGDDNDATLGDLIRSPEPSPEEQFFAKVDADILEDLLKTLNQKTRFAVKARFGLLDGERKSFRYIGEELGVTAEAVRRLISRAVDSLRDVAEENYDYTGKRG